MKFKFALIKHIDDVLPHIEGRKEFFVSEREHYTIINYNVTFADTFDMENPDDIGAIYRRECRGIMFYPDGKLMSRPFHKFFNIGEKPECILTSLTELGDSIVLDKMDGSMIRPCIVDGKIRLATKMGHLTDTAQEAEATFGIGDYHNFILPKKQEWQIRQWLNADLTPIFEFVSPHNKIVVNYKEAQLVLLAVRHNYTGQYMTHKSLLEYSSTFTIVDRIDAKFNGEEFIHKLRRQRDTEGVIITFPSGHMVKCKTEWYCLLHRLKDSINREKDLVELIMKGDFDDIFNLPIDEGAKIQLKSFNAHFTEAYRNKLAQIKKECSDYISRLTKDSDAFCDEGVIRKRFAVECVPHLGDNKPLAKFVFATWDGKDIDKMFLDMVNRSLSTHDDWRTFKKWFNMTWDGHEIAWDGVVQQTCIMCKHCGINSSSAGCLLDDTSKCLLENIDDFNNMHMEEEKT